MEKKSQWRKKKRQWEGEQVIPRKSSACTLWLNSPGKKKWVLEWVPVPVCVCVCIWSFFVVVVVVVTCTKWRRWKKKRVHKNEKKKKRWTVEKKGSPLRSLQECCSLFPTQLKSPTHVHDKNKNKLKKRKWKDKKKKKTEEKKRKGSLIEIALGKKKSKEVKRFFFQDERLETFHALWLFWCCVFLFKCVFEYTVFVVVVRLSSFCVRVRERSTASFFFFFWTCIGMYAFVWA